MTFSAEIVLFIFFWPIFFTQVTFPRNDEYTSKQLKAIKIADHYLPLVALVTDYIISNPVFVMRHIIFSFTFGCIYMFVNMITALADVPAYANLDWKSAGGVLIPLALIFVFPIIHLVLFYLTRYRLQRDPFKNQTILKVLQLASIYTLNSYRFS